MGRNLLAGKDGLARPVFWKLAATLTKLGGNVKHI